MPSPPALPAAPPSPGALTRTRGTRSAAFAGALTGGVGTRSAAGAATGKRSLLYPGEEATPPGPGAGVGGPLPNVTVRTVGSVEVPVVEPLPGHIGAYSVAERARRIARFMEKRAARIWHKNIKYEVRKNFADSRLRVKGRFVPKDHEQLLRDFLMMV